MDWQNYYETLERWLKEQQQTIALSEQRLYVAALEQHRVVRANLLASERYQIEMSQLQSSCSRNSADTHGQVSNAGINQREPLGAHRFKIPHPWRRVAAELIDTFVLLLFKLFLIYVISGSSSLLEIVKYFGLNFMSAAPEYRTLRRAQLWAKSEAYKDELSLTKLERPIFAPYHETDLVDLDVLLIVDHIGRMVGAFVEAIFISYSLLARGPGGCTIGKWIMNLRVVSCDAVISLPDTVDVIPGTNLGMVRALVRSMLKQTTFLTACSFFCMLIFRYHRCTYDILAGTLVVQPIPADQRNNEEEQ